MSCTRKMFLMALNKFSKYNKFRIISLHRKKENDATQQIVNPFTLSAFTMEAKLASIVNFHFKLE